MRFSFEFYDVARLIKCCYSELAISKSSVMQGSVDISDMFAISACSALLNYLGCLLSDSLTRFDSCCFVYYNVGFEMFSLMFNPAPTFLKVTLM